MANPRQRRKRHGHAKVKSSRRQQKNLKKMPRMFIDHPQLDWQLTALAAIRGPKALSDAWDETKTVRQKCARRLSSKTSIADSTLLAMPRSVWQSRSAPLQCLRQPLQVQHKLRTPTPVHPCRLDVDASFVTRQGMSSALNCHRSLTRMSRNRQAARRRDTWTATRRRIRSCKARRAMHIFYPGHK